MDSDSDSSPCRVRANPAFVTTRWSVVVRAGAEPQTAHVQEALAHLCQTYWYPLYGYARRRGLSPQDAQDLTQSFFERLLQRNWIANADPQRGRFRTFLLTAMSRFMSDQWDRQQALKRGGGAFHVPLELEGAEERYRHEPADYRTPEQYFERRWALTILDTVLRRLRAEYAGEAAATFEILSGSLIGDRDGQPYKVLGEKLGISEGATRVAVHRMRKQYRHLLREEISQTMAEGSDVEEELRYLLAILSTPGAQGM
jgi:RNA polymerase sigma-70 factor (ECF subfamily)